jgi:thiamine-monophosphate kinase
VALRKAQQPLTEFALIDSLARRFPARAPGLVRGIGDDAAVVTLPANRQLVLTTDLLAEGIHFEQHRSRISGTRPPSPT